MLPMMLMPALRIRRASMQRTTAASPRCLCLLEGSPKLSLGACLQSGRGISRRGQARVFSACWVALLKRRFPADVYKSVLAQMHTRILPRLTNPLVMADFLTDAYDIGTDWR